MGQRLNTLRQNRAVGVTTDGTTIVYSAAGQLFQRPLNDPRPTPIPGTQQESPLTPIFSPNGRSIAFYTFSIQAGRSAIKRVPADGGAAVTLHTFGQGEQRPAGVDVSLSWSGNRILYAGTDGVWAGPDDGGAPRRLVQTNPATEVVSAPQLIDGGRHLLFTLRRLLEQYRTAGRICECEAGHAEDSVATIGCSSPQSVQS